MNFESLPIWGSPFAHIETYVYYGGPRTFAMKSVHYGFYVFVNTVDEDEDEGTLTTLIAYVPTEKFWKFRIGDLPFRDAFTNALDGHVVVWSPSESLSTLEPSSIEPLPEQIPLKWLPTADARLSMPPSRVQPYDEQEVQRLSLEQNRSIVALKVSSPGNVTQFPARAAGELQVSFDREFRSLVRKRSTAQASRELVPMVVGLRAASFVMIIAVESTNSIMEDSAAGSAIDDISELVSSVQKSPEVFLERLAHHDSVTRNHFVEILETLQETGSGLALTASGPTGQTRTAAMEAESVRTAWSAVHSAPPEKKTIEVSRGALIGLHIRLANFEILDVASGTRYRGKIDPEALRDASTGLAVGTQEYVSATIRVEVPFAVVDGERGTRYFLTKISELR